MRTTLSNLITSTKGATAKPLLNYLKRSQIIFLLPAGIFAKTLLTYDFSGTGTAQPNPQKAVSLKLSRRSLNNRQSGSADLVISTKR